MKKYIKIAPVCAVEVVKENEEEIIKLLESGTTGFDILKDETGNIIGYMVHSWEGVEPVFYDITKNPKPSKYWIIRGVKGECYPCEGNVFEERYVEVK